jgi:hypothetical protein
LQATRSICTGAPERFGVELDTYEFHGDRVAFEQDRIRQEELKLAGIDTVRITGRRLDREPDVVMRRLAALLMDRRRQRGRRSSARAQEMGGGGGEADWEMGGGDRGAAQ